MKTYNDVKVGDTVYIWGKYDTQVEETTVIKKEERGGHWDLKFGNGCEGEAYKDDTASPMGAYACHVYSDKKAVRKAINKHIKELSNIKI